jgi:pilus assembly protein CpaB
LPLRAQSAAAAVEEPEGDLEAWQNDIEHITPRVERKKPERKGVEALRAEALQAVISRVEDRNFNGLRERVTDRLALPRRVSMSRVPLSRIVLVVVALFAGGLAAYFALQGEAPAIVPTEAPAPVVIAAPTSRILVASVPIGMGQRLNAESVEWKDWPAGEIRPEYITAEAMPEAQTQMGGTVARFEFFPGEPIRKEKLATAEQGYLSAVLDTGMRGVSVSVAASSASGGFIVPNDHVDVVLTRSGETGKSSETILHNVRVLAINARLGETGETGAPADPTNPKAEVFSDQAIATLELNPQQSEVIINSASAGELSLVLRAIVDFAETDQPDINQTIRMTSPFWAK